MFVSGLIEQYFWFTTFLANTSISWVIVNDVSLSCFTVNFFFEDFHPVFEDFHPVTLWLSTCAVPKTALKITWQAFRLYVIVPIPWLEASWLSPPDNSWPLSLLSSESVDGVSFKSSLSSLSLFSTYKNKSKNNNCKLLSF